VGKALVQSVLDRARVAQKTTVLLDTAPDSMAPAYRLYLEMGFQICPPYNGAGTEGITYMRKSTEKP
jgi:ribosomal protein S18 acetylase RimI-like enzyme